MSCTESTYCLNNTGNNSINDNYLSGGTHNGNLYYTGVSNNLFIYYSSSNDEWCLSTALDGSCIMSGDSPGAPDCPDLSDFYFSVGICPTPTPTPTPAVDCSTLDFEAIFDCDVTPTPSLSSTPTPTPTPTVTPTSTDICGGTDIIASIESITPTPTATPTMTPTSSSPTVRPCVFSGDVTFNVIEGDIVCPYSYEFQDCYNGAIYLTTSQVSSPSGSGLEEFDIFNANVNGETRCISFIDINLTEIGGDIINLISGPIGKSNLGDCIYCGPSPSVTPTSTVTPTPTPTETLPITGIQLKICCDEDVYFIFEGYWPGLTMGVTYNYNFDNNDDDICATVVPFSGVGPTYTYSGLGNPVIMLQGCNDLECPSCFPDNFYVYRRCDDEKVWLVQSIQGDTTTPGKVEKDNQSICWEFQYVSVGLPNLDPGDTIINYSGNYFLTSVSGVYENCDSCNTPCNSNWVLDCITFNNDLDITELIGSDNAGRTQMWVDNSGQRLYTITPNYFTGFTIKQHTISIANDITSSINYNIGISPAITKPIGSMLLSDDGSKVYLQSDNSNNTDKTVRQHTLSTNWDISTMSTTPDVELLPPSNVFVPRGMCFSKTGDVFYMTYQSNITLDVHLASWNLSTNWDLSTVGAPTISNIDSISQTTLGITLILVGGLETLIQFSSSASGLSAFRNGISPNDLFESDPNVVIDGSGPISSSNSDYIYTLVRGGSGYPFTWKIEQYLTNV
ncbi:hypothetical protein N9P74_00035 [bacterium]|nr:hypothetical protein [bacterium]